MGSGARLVGNQLRVARVALPTGIVGPHVISIDAGLITKIEPIALAACELIDVTLCPGFIDLQINGIDGVDVSTASGEDFAALDAAILRQGTTSWCPTLVSSAIESYAKKFERIGAAMARPAQLRPCIIGIHLEGPFLGGALGAHDTKYGNSKNTDFVSRLPDFVKIMTVAPDNAVAAGAIGELIRRNIVVSIGHTRALDAQMLAAVDAGATMITHLFNAMSEVHHRHDSVALIALTDDRLATGLIADLVHVSDRAIDLAFRAKPENVILVTDAIAHLGELAKARGIEIVGGAPRLADGTLAGSTLRMNEAIRNCVRSGVSEHRAITAATKTPARILGLFDRGQIAVGARADLVTLDGDFQVRSTWVAGEMAFDGR